MHKIKALLLQNEFHPMVLGTDSSWNLQSEFFSKNISWSLENFKELDFKFLEPIQKLWIPVNTVKSGEAIIKVASLSVACFDLILSPSPSMKIQIMGRKITENLGFESQLQKVKKNLSFALFVFKFTKNWLQQMGLPFLKFLVDFQIFRDFKSVLGRQLWLEFWILQTRQNSTHNGSNCH